MYDRNVNIKHKITHFYIIANLCLSGFCHVRMLHLQHFELMNSLMHIQYTGIAGSRYLIGWRLHRQYMYFITIKIINIISIEQHWNWSKILPTADAKKKKEKIKRRYLPDILTRMSRIGWLNAIIINWI